MKYIIFLGDGMADDPVMCVDGKTPLMVASKPNIDRLCQMGRCGQLVTVDDDMPCGSEIANMSILGYDPHVSYQGRGVLEAASMGVDVAEGQLACRCNLICVKDGCIKNHSAGHIGTLEARELVGFLNENLDISGVHIYPGVSYRHLLLIDEGSSDVELMPPHDAIGRDVSEIMPRGTSEKGNEMADVFSSMITRSWDLLIRHPVNVSRVGRGLDPANSLWMWSIGVRPRMEKFYDRFGLHGAVISAVDLIRGLGVYAGFDVIEVEGATGLYDTNYEGKADACVEALRDHDIVYVHVEAPDEAGHEGNYDLKVRTIEDLDSRLIGRVLSKLNDVDDDIRIAVLPDHKTPIKLKTHDYGPVPFIVCDFKVRGNRVLNVPDCVVSYNEVSCEKGEIGKIFGDAFIRGFLSGTF